jgi:hypothetical protein
MFLSWIGKPRRAPSPAKTKSKGRRKPARLPRPMTLELLESRLCPAGTWTPLTNLAPAGTGTMVLMTDGTVLVQRGGTSSTWYRLTPDSTGSYLNGTWSQAASMGTARLYGGSVVLPNGKFLFVGGEYSGPSGANNWTNTGEIYDSLANTWLPITNFPQSQFGDDPLEVLPNGTVLAGYLAGPQTYIYNPATNAWSQAGSKLRSDRSDEETWVKLADNSILSYDVFASNTTAAHAQRYVPSSNTWVDAGTVPVLLSSSSVGSELGPGFLLPDGRVFQLGGNSNSAIYTPSTNTWVTGPVNPNSSGADDAPGAVLPNGHVIFAADTPTFKAPTLLFDFDPTTNGLTQMTLPTALATSLNEAAFVTRMLMLPSGDLLLSTSGNQLWVYNTGTTPNAAWRPTISNIVSNGGVTYTLTGTQLNGISEGAGYGDDAEMASNYPIVELKSGSTVYRARTFNWVSLVATGSTPVSTQFTLPAGLPQGVYSLTVIANGIASNPFTFSNLSLTLSPSSLPADTLNIAYNQTITASGGTGGYTFTESGSLPAGVTFSSSGVLSGTPTVAGSFPITVNVTDPSGDAGSRNYTLVINPPVTITTTALASWTLSKSGYSQTFATSGGTGTPTFTAPSASLPPGLTLSSSGVLSGTPSAAGSYTFTVTAKDTVNASASQSFTITINPGVTIATTTVPNWTINLAGYSQTISAMGGTGGLTFSSTGTLPSGINLSSAGILSGKPTATGSFTFTVKATDTTGASASQSFTIIINPPVAITTTTLAVWTASKSGYSQTIAATGGTGGLTFTAPSASVPPGLTLSSAGVLSGTPNTAGTYTLPVTATDTVGASATVSFSVTINPFVTLAPTSLPADPINVAYNQTITANGGTGAKSLVVQNLNGAIPGLNVPASGTNSLTISGTPTATGTETFTVVATDAVGESALTNYSITVNPASAFLSMPTSGYSGQTNSTLAYPISISQLSDVASSKHVGLSSAILALTFPTGVFNFPIGSNLASSDVSLGSVPLSDTAGPGGVNDWTLTANSPADGKLNITLTARTGDNITSDTGGGSLVIVNFPIKPLAPLGNVSLTLINNTGGHTQVSGNNGLYTLSPTPPYSGSLSITQGPQNPPSVPASQAYSTEANVALSQAAPGLLAGATDPQGEPLSVGTVNGSAANVHNAITLASGATLTVQADGSFVYTPANNYLGTDSFTFQAIDTGNSLSNTGTATITLVPTLTLTPLNNTGSPGQTVTEQIVLDNPVQPASGPLESFNLVLTYDSSVLSVANINPGSALPPDWTFTQNTTTPGVIAYAGYGSGSGGDLVSGPAPLVLASIDFTINTVPTQSTQVDLAPTANTMSGPINTSILGSSGGFTLNPPLSTSYVAGQDATLSVVVLNVGPGSLPAGEGNAPYQQTFSATGGTGPYTFAVTAGTLPPGLTLNSNGVLSSTPSTSAGSPFGFTVTATDALNHLGAKDYSVTITPGVTITTSTLAGWTVNANGYSQTIQATGGTGSYTFTTTSSLPPGLNLSSAGVLSGSPTVSGTFTFMVTAGDSFGSTTSQTYTLTINPPVTIINASLTNWTVNVAGYSQTLNTSGGTAPLTFTSPGTLPTGLSLNSTGVITGTPVTTGTFRFNVIAKDSVGVTGSHLYTIIINPSVTITTTALEDWTTGLSGYSQTISGSGGTGTLTFAASTGLPPGLTLSGSGVLSGTPSLAGTYTFSVTATDGVGASGSQSYNIVINPPVTITTTTLADWPVNQPGYSQTINATGGTGVLTFFALGTLPTGLTLSSAGVLSGTPTEAGAFSFEVLATDSVGATVSEEYLVTIQSSLATQLALDIPPTATAGVAFTLTVTAQDSSGHTAAGYSGTVTLSSSAGPDLAPTTILLTNGTGMVSATLTTAGTQTLTASVSGLTSALSSITVTPGPLVQYLVSTLSSTGSITAGTNFVVQVQAADQFGNALSSYSGPATVTASLNPASTSSFPVAVAMSSSGLGLALAQVQLAGTYTIAAAAASYSGSSSPITVTPAAPARLAFVAQPVSTPTGVTLSPVTVEIHDVFGNLVSSDNTDSVTLGIASGPLGAAGFTAGSITTMTAHNGVVTFDHLTLVTPGTYTLSEVVPTLYTGPNSTVFSAVPLQVVPGSFASSSSGFALQFNAPFLVNSTTPVLYGSGFGATAPVPSVTLTQTKDGSGNPVHKPIVGSLVLSTSTNSLTFLATDTSLLADTGSAILPDGTYTAVVHSSAATDGLQALNAGGGFLDGLSSDLAGSGDYTATFTVNAAAAHQDIVWLPATADGPGQPLNAPGNNQAGGGYPLYLTDTTATVTSVQVTLNYDPTLLTVTGVTGSHFALLGPSTPGHAVLQYSGPALPAGSQTAIGFVTATVPSGTVANPMPYRAKDLLHLSGVSVNGGSIAATTSDALHLVAYVGDADGNGAYGSNDAVFITRTALQTDTGFTAYPLVDPVIVADTDGSGFIPADAALQANEAGVGFPTPNLPSPPIPSGVVFQPVANNVDPALSLELRAQSPEQNNGAIVTAEVNLDDADPVGSTGLIEGHLALTYDPRQFSVTAADVHPGSVLSAGNGWRVLPTIDPATGQIGIAFSSDTPIRDSIGGSLVTIDFHALQGITNPSSIALATSASPNGQLVSTELEDAQGTFTLSPSPASSARITSTAEWPGQRSSAAVLTDGSEYLARDRGPALLSVDDTSAASPAETIPPRAAAVATPEENSSATTPLTIQQSPVPVHTITPDLVLLVRGVLFPFANPTAINVPNSPSLTGWQRLTDQVFQAMVQVVPICPALPASEAISPSPAIRPDDLDGRGAGRENLRDWTFMGIPFRHPDSVSRQIPRDTPQKASDLVAINQAFAHAANEQDTGEDE